MPIIKRACDVKHDQVLMPHGFFRKIFDRFFGQIFELIFWSILLQKFWKIIRQNFWKIFWQIFWKMFWKIFGQNISQILWNKGIISFPTNLLKNKESLSTHYTCYSNSRGLLLFWVVWKMMLFSCETIFWQMDELAGRYFLKP